MNALFPKPLVTTENCGSGPYIPGGLLLQWHLTERCNLRCEHCYQDAYGGAELTFEQWLGVLDQYLGLLEHWRRLRDNTRVRGHITVTGGEPFVRPDFIDLLEVFAKNSKHFSYAILTNGSFIDAPMARKLRTLSPGFIQVSIEGNRETHDRIRGEGNFDETISALQCLVRENIPTMISFTAHRGNYREFPEVAELGRQLKVAKVWSDRFLPRGAGADMGREMLTPEETREFFELMEEARRRIHRKWFNKTEIAMHRALQFLVGHGKPYHCYAGDSLITLQPDGELYPCRRMPIGVGNVLETPLKSLYEQSELFNALRNPNKISEGCEPCFYNKLCRGGLKCLSYAVTGDPFQKDPGCWHEDETPSHATNNAEFTE